MTKVVKMLCVFMFILLHITSTVSGRNKLLLTVYYESECPDSRKFIINQLRPAIHLLHSYVKLHLIPFGKSRSINYGDDGFECQHGSSECLGNIVQDCTLDMMNKLSDKKKVEYVTCEMETRAGANGYLNCVEKAKLSPKMVEDCVLTGKGIILQLHSEYYTDLVSPKFIPTVTFDGVFDQETQDNAQIDLIGTICAVLSEAPPCADRYNNMALQYVLVDQR